jgi:hypothetical protein
MSRQDSEFRIAICNVIDRAVSADELDDIAMMEDLMWVVLQLFIRVSGNPDPPHDVRTALTDVLRKAKMAVN